MLMTFRRLGCALALTLLLPRVGSADIMTPVTGLVVFGDSLSDTGNVSAATNGAFPPAPYSNGRFSNGPIWVEQFAKDLGLPAPTPSAKGGTDYAYGFAQTGTGLSATSVPGLSVPNMGMQVSTYLANNTPTAGQLFVLWGGANDFFNNQTNPAVPASNITTEIQNLAQAGAKNFLVLNMPELGQTPFGATLTPAQQQGLNALSDAYNSALKSDLTLLGAANPNLTIGLADVSGLLQNIQANPSAYGFTNATDAALLTGHATDPGYLFWDSVHPTTQADAFIAATAVQALPEPASLTLTSLAALGLFGWNWQRRKLAGQGLSLQSCGHIS
jgi:phospholipase/lecithinase/hemolysin